MTKKEHKEKNSRSKLKRFTIISVFALILLLAVPIFIPIETFRVGECGNQIVRLSLVSNGRERLDQARIDENERIVKKREFLKQNPGLAMGCSTGGKTYVLYLL